MNNAALCVICLEPGHLGEAHYDGHALVAIGLGVLLIADQASVVALLLAAYSFLALIVACVRTQPPRVIGR